MEPNQLANPQQPTQPEMPQNSKFSFIKYLKLWQIVVLLVLLIPTTAYFLSKNQTTKQISTVQSSPTPASGPTAKWKTQINKDYKFSFRYPSKFAVAEKKEVYKDVPNVIYYYYTFSTRILIQNQPDFSGFTVTVTPTNGKTINQEFSNQPSGFGDSVVKVQSISPAEGTDEAANLINSAQNARVYRAGNNFFQVEHFQNDNLLPDRSDDIMRYFDQILSTLKFTQ